jgi:hypothetical protein
METNVLLLGASGMLFSDAGPEATLGALLQRELSSRRGEVDWRCFAEEIPPARDMAARVAAAVEHRPPAAVVLAISASYFTYDYVVARVRRRWPRLYPLARRLTGETQRVAGAGIQGSDSLRGELFRLPRRFATAVVGAEPYMKVEHAVENTVAALDVLRGLPGVITLCDLPRMNTRLPADDMARYRPRLQRFVEAVSAACKERSIYAYDLEQEMARAGLRAARVADGLHSDLPTRQWQAAFIADRILERLPRQEGAGTDA